MYFWIFVKYILSLLDMPLNEKCLYFKFFLKSPGDLMTANEGIGV